MATWFFQANPKLYDIDAALGDKRVLYWRIPQHRAEVHRGDRALIWRSGKPAGLVGWGVVLAEPEHYDISLSHDPHWNQAAQGKIGEFYVPLQAWAARELPKADVAQVIPNHQIVIAPMGTVFRLKDEDLSALQPLLDTYGFNLSMSPDDTFTEFLPVITPAEPEPEPEVGVSAKVTPALFLLSSSPDHPTEITIEGDALLLALAERDALGSLDESWDAVGVYLLLNRPENENAALSVYVGKAQGLRSRVKTGHQMKDWSRCLLVQRPGLHSFNASDISWLERRLIDVLLEAPQMDLINKVPPPPEMVPGYKAEILERTVVAILGVLGVLGAYTV